MESLLRTAAGLVSTSIQSNIHAKYLIEDKPQFRAGLWRVHRAARRAVQTSTTQRSYHASGSTTSATGNSSGGAVQYYSVWTFDRVDLEGQRSSWSGNSAHVRKTQFDVIYEMLKKDATTLARLRHPSLLQLVENVEESRNGLVFVTEYVTASLRSLHPEPDELEFQKGLSQICKALSFCHQSAFLVHGNLTPDSILVNEKGDWKLGGFGFSLSMKAADGRLLSSGEIKALWIYPEADARLPDGCQRDLDYMAPEYAFDELISFSNDLFALGCLVHYGKLKRPPFECQHSLSTYKQNIDRLPLIFSNALPEALRDLLSRLLTRTSGIRLTLQAFETHRYFDNILVSTIRFLESLPEKKTEQRIAFLKGLPRVLSQFPERVIKFKMLPTLLDQTTDISLLPLVIPNILVIVRDHVSPQDFVKNVLPRLSRCLVVKDPPQVAICLLRKEHVKILKEKTSMTVFKESVMPMIYSALAVDGPAELQEAALKAIPDLIQEEAIDYTTVKSQLFPAVSSLFSLTTLLSVKVNTLICFNAISANLDKYTLTESMIPLLKAVRTKEPAVTVAVLAVYEQIGKKVDREVIAVHILPALWSMAIAPRLNEMQFKKFMAVIKEYSIKVEREHLSLLSANRQDHPHSLAAIGTDTTAFTNGNTSTELDPQSIDFETLVHGSIPDETRPIMNDPFEVISDRTKSISSASSFVPLQPSMPVVHPSSRFTPAGAHGRPHKPGSGPSLQDLALGPRTTVGKTAVPQASGGQSLDQSRAFSLNNLALSQASNLQTADRKMDKVPLHSPSYTSAWNSMVQSTGQSNIQGESLI